MLKIELHTNSTKWYLSVSFFRTNLSKFGEENITHLFTCIHVCVIFSHLPCFTTLKTICFKCTESYRMIRLLINYQLTFVAIRDYEEQPRYKKKSCFISTPVITKDAGKYPDLASLLNLLFINIILSRNCERCFIFMRKI